MGSTRDEAEPPPQQDAACDGCENKSAAPRTRPLSTCLMQVEEVRIFTFNYMPTLWQFYLERLEVVDISYCGSPVSRFIGSIDTEFDTNINHGIAGVGINIGAG